MRGTGLAFVDLVVLLYEGRGGRFEPGPDGELRYVPSGREPVLHVGSPRGSLYHAKTTTAARRPPDAAPVPRPGGRRPAGRARSTVDLRTEVWPLMAKEIAWGWYHELLRGHPDRVRLPWADTSPTGTPRATGAPRRWTRSSPRPCPTRSDRFDLDALDRPLDGVRADSPRRPAAAGARAHRRGPAPARRRTAHPAPRRVRRHAVGVRRGRRRWSPRCCRCRSRGRDMRRWQSFFNSVASGPPGFRVRRAAGAVPRGFVRFLGPGMWVEIADGAFRATSARSRRGGHGRRARRRPAARPQRVPHRGPAARGAAAPRRVASEEMLATRRRRAAQHRPAARAPADGALVDADGPRAPPAVRDRAAHHRAGGRRVHPARDERPEPALQRRRRPRRPAQPARGGRASSAA